VNALGALFIELDEHHFRQRPEEFRRLEGPARAPALIAGMIAAEDALVLVAEDSSSGAIVGLAHVFKREFPETLVSPQRLVAELDSLVIAADRRRAGIATRLVLEAQRWTDHEGLAALELSVREFNHAALSFYEALGFEGLSRRLRSTLPRQN
jgi:ribosomal protein S18 acetylase RimI-like enzyme